MCNYIHRMLPAFLACFSVAVVILLWSANKAFNGPWIWWAAAAIQVLAGMLIGKVIQRLSVRAYTDMLTSLWNRRYFDTRLAEELKRSSRNKAPLSLALIDVDDFKVVNDTCGHRAGDEVLKRIASVLRSSTRSIDIQARWGGDEFAVIFPETGLDGAAIVAERIRQAVEDEKLHCNTTISVGVVVVSNTLTIGDVLALADKALYRAKEEKNAITILDEDNRHSVSYA